MATGGLVEDRDDSRKSLTSNIPEHWNDAQRGVWRCVDLHWGHLLEKNVEAFIEYIHPEFVGYGHESPLPVDRPWLEKWVGFWTKSTQIAICELRPVHIKMHGDFAVVQYFIFTVEINAEGGKRVIRRYTMTWMKTPDRWVVVASHNNLVNETIKG
jgi:hypothetical protein